ncbi:unnamed protein product [Gordionus sp. m RMFG-2023]
MIESKFHEDCKNTERLKKENKRDRRTSKNYNWKQVPRRLCTERLKKRIKETGEHQKLQMIGSKFHEDYKITERLKKENKRDRRTSKNYK